MLTQIGVTGEQRAQAAAAIETFQQKREAVGKLAEPPELLTALSAVREALLRGEPPTPQMREAVEATQPRDDGAIDRAFSDAQAEVLSALEAALTEEQREQLGILQLVRTAEDIIGMCMESRMATAEEGQQMRLRAFGELRDQLAAAAGGGADQVLSDLQSLINRIAALTPEQASAQREQLVGQIVTLLKTTLDKQPEAVKERLRDQLWEWAMEPRVGRLLRESAEAMGAP
jgi:hypothetical protein